MKFKKLMSMAVAAAMILALSVPAFAAPGGGTTSGSTTSGSTTSGSTTSGGATSDADENTVAVSSSIMTPTVNVTVPTAGAVILNPYKMQFTAGDTDSNAAFYSAPIVCTNASNCDLNIAVKATAKAEGEVVITAANDVSTGTDAGPKNVSLTLKTGKFADADSTTHTGSTTDLALEAADREYGFGTSSDDVTTPLNMPYSEDPTYFGFILDGKVNDNTEKVWAETDKVSVTIVLSFTPRPIAATS